MMKLSLILAVLVAAVLSDTKTAHDRVMPCDRKIYDINNRGHMNYHINLGYSSTHIKAFVVDDAAEDRLTDYLLSGCVLDYWPSDYFWLSGSGCTDISTSCTAHFNVPSSGDYKLVVINTNQAGVGYSTVTYDLTLSTESSLGGCATAVIIIGCLACCAAIIGGSIYWRRRRRMALMGPPLMATSAPNIYPNPPMQPAYQPVQYTTSPVVGQPIQPGYYQQV